MRHLFSHHRPLCTAIAPVPWCSSRVERHVALDISTHCWALGSTWERALKADLSSVYYANLKAFIDKER